MCFGVVINLLGVGYKIRVNLGVIYLWRGKSVLERLILNIWYLVKI
jgi:hypothetical protein